MDDKARLEQVSTAIGKKLLWTYQDPETQLFYLLFEGGTLLSSGDVALLPDGKAVAEKLLTESFDGAARIIDLKNLMETVYGKPLAAPTEGGSQPPSQA